MSDIDNKEKPKLGARAPLGLKRTVETGKVKQSFSHGRSNTVVVEVKKRRILGPGAPQEAAPAPVQEAPKPAAPAPVARPPQPAPRPAASCRRKCCARPRKPVSPNSRKPAAARTARPRPRPRKRSAAPRTIAA